MKGTFSLTNLPHPQPHPPGTDLGGECRGCTPLPEIRVSSASLSGAPPLKNDPGSAPAPSLSGNSRSFKILVVSPPPLPCNFQ